VNREPIVLALGTGRRRFAYETAMALLALLVIGLLPYDNVGSVRIVNLTVWAIFVVDYFVRLALATDRRAHIRANIVDLVAILPADFFRVTRLLRLVRLLRVIRAAAILSRISRDLRGIANTNGLKWLLLTTSIAIVSGAIVVWRVEPSIQTLADALWWAFVTATTVGYGDLSPANGLGRAAAVGLMLVGIGTIGMLTGSIATYFLGGAGADALPADIEHVRTRLSAWASLDPTERRGLAELLRVHAEGVAQQADLDGNTAG
jgi:voltage-gated potassium channel